MIYTPTSSSIMVTDSIISPYSTVSTISPYTTIIPPLTINFDFDKPFIGPYETIDNNPKIRKIMIKYYFDLLRDKWLLDELNDILNYFQYKNGRVELIDNWTDYSPNNIMRDTDEIAENKIEYIEKYIFTKYDLINVMTKFTTETNTKWVDLPKNELIFRKIVKDQIIREIKKKLKGNKSTKI